MTNKFLNDCFKLLKSSEEARKRYNLNHSHLTTFLYTYNDGRNDLRFWFGVDFPINVDAPIFGDICYRYQIMVIQNLLSKVKNPETGELQAVMSFLDFEVEKEIENIQVSIKPKTDPAYSLPESVMFLPKVLKGIQNGEVLIDVIQSQADETLLEILNKAFNEAITLQGKTLDEALELLDIIYKENIK